MRNPTCSMANSYRATSLRSIRIKLIEQSKMQMFEDLASSIHTTWTHCGRDERVFPELCQSSLKRFSALALCADDVFRWLVTTENLPPQSDPDSKFGNVAL